MPSQLFDSFRSFYRALGAYPWWQVAIELLLIGLVVYWVVRFLRGTRGARMLKGIAFVLIACYLIVSLLAAQFGLERIAVPVRAVPAVRRRSRSSSRSSRSSAGR